MHIRRIDEQTIELGGLDLLCCELLHQIGPSANLEDNAAAQERFFGSPSGGAEPEFDRDWESFVHPDLKDLFASAMQVIQGDLDDFPKSGEQEPFTLHFPSKHLEAWIHGLNQARLALAARHNFTDQQLEQEMPMEGDSRALALFQIHFYGFLQEFFLRQVA